MKGLVKIFCILLLLGSFFGCKKTTNVDDETTGTSKDAPNIPVFTSMLGEDPETQIKLSWTTYTGFGLDNNNNPIDPANVAYKVEVSQDGATFIPLPTAPYSLLTVTTPHINISAMSLSSKVKELVVGGLTINKNYWFRLTAINEIGKTGIYTSPNSLQTLDKRLADVSTQSSYTKEEEGGPARANWEDVFRFYPEVDFFKQGRYVLTWRKDPGQPGPKGNYNPAERWELYQILFKDPDAMKDPSKFGIPIDPKDIAEIKTLKKANANPPNTIRQTVTLPSDLLPSVNGSPASTTGIILDLAGHSQYGYFPINRDNNAMAAVVAYKVRLFRTIDDFDAKGNPIKKEIYNDGEVIFVNWRDGKFKIAHQGATGTGATPGAAVDPVAGPHIPDNITTLSQVRTKLGYPSTQNFSQTWESKKITGTTPLEQLITKADYEALFPPDIRALFHDKNGTYYTYENFVNASRYFPNFLNEGTKEDKYRELAAVLGNKSHETGDGWRALGADRWKYGLVWIVELTALQASGLPIQVKDQEDLYKAYSPAPYWDGNNTKFPPVKGKSYHGRGPVQLSWNYNYGAMSEALFGDKSILLENPDLLARDGLLGWASAIWFWMQPQGNKPSAHDVMVGNVDLSEPYTVPISRDAQNQSTVRTHTADSKGHDAAGNAVSYQNKQVPKGVEVGFGMTINIINGGLESNTGTLDGRHFRRITFFARYLDYFGTTKQGRDDRQNLPISPAVRNKNGVGGDPVPAVTIELLKDWRKWIDIDGTEDDRKNGILFPKNDIPSIIGSQFQGSIGG